MLANASHLNFKLYVMYARIHRVTPTGDVKSVVREGDLFNENVASTMQAPGEATPRMERISAAHEERKRPSLPMDSLNRKPTHDNKDAPV